MLHKDHQEPGFRVLTPEEVVFVSGGNDNSGNDNNANNNCVITTNIEIRFNYDTNQNEEVTTYHLLCQTEDSPRYQNVTQTASLEDWQSADGFDPNNQEMMDWIIDMLHIDDGVDIPGTTENFGLGS
ncbi:hypothetical protein [uncultured Erythrobacter sp.]|uniref:hypothetical protein n=1 Tax=uncultured Erythrobacter sp. TaxID=263913 RepID=UPI00262075FD|nr:hypothetical protein [uncultured Erythrobacter sp.]